MRYFIIIATVFSLTVVARAQQFPSLLWPQSPAGNAGNSLNGSKIATFAPLQSGRMSISKITTIAPLQAGQMNTSKLVAGRVLLSSQIITSKLVAYAVVQSVPNRGLVPRAPLTHW